MWREHLVECAYFLALMILILLGNLANMQCTQKKTSGAPHEGVLGTVGGATFEFLLKTHCPYAEPRDFFFCDTMWIEQGLHSVRLWCTGP